MKKTSAKSIFFLMELCIVILFFSLASAICVSVYAKSSVLNDQANARKQALIYAQNTIDDLQNQNFLEDHYRLNENFQVSADGVYEVSIKEVAEGGELTILYKEKEIVSIAFALKGGTA